MIERIRNVEYRALGLGFLSFAVIAAVWQLLAVTGAVEAFLISSPSRTFGALAEQLSSGVLLSNLVVSLQELAIGFGVAVLVGIPVGTAMGWYRFAEYSLDPFVWFGYSAPLVALYPVFVVIFGLGQPTVIVITFLLAVCPVIVNTASGVRNVDKSLVHTARSFGAGDEQLFRKVALPAAVPIVMAGLRLGIGRALVGVVVGELFVGNAGLGYSISYYGGLMDTSNMLAAVVVVGLLGVLLTQLVGVLERRLDSWRPEVAKA